MCHFTIGNHSEEEPKIGEKSRMFVVISREVAQFNPRNTAKNNCRN